MTARRLDKTARRRLERKLKKIMERDGDHCTLCRRPLVHGDRSYGGAVAGGKAAVTGGCCADRLTHVVGGGVYLDLAGAYANLAADVVKRAGIGGRPIALSVTDAPWTLCGSGPTPAGRTGSARCSQGKRRR